MRTASMLPRVIIFLTIFILIFCEKGTAKGISADSLRNSMPAATTEALMLKALQLSNDNNKEGHYDLSLQYLNLYYDYKDSLHKDKVSKELQQLQFDHELSRKQAQIELLDKDRLIGRSRTWGLLSGAALLLIIIGLLLRSRQYELRTKKQLSLQAARLNELNQFKDRIFSVLSHDLRDPLNALSQTMYLLDEHLLSIEAFNELKPEVSGQLSALSFLLDNLLKWSKNYVTGNNTVNLEILNLNNIVRQNIALMQNAADRKKINIVNEVSLPAVALADAGQLDIIVRNILSNALKFMLEQGTVTISSRESGDMVELIFADTGIGMSEQQLSRLFTDVPENSTQGTKGEKGIGLGLLLCNEFIKANHGSIHVVSQPGAGSTFTIMLPAG